MSHCSGRLLTFHVFGTVRFVLSPGCVPVGRNAVPSRPQVLWAPTGTVPVVALENSLVHTTTQSHQGTRTLKAVDFADVFHLLLFVPYRGAFADRARCICCHRFLVALLPVDAGITDSE